MFSKVKRIFLCTTLLGLPALYAQSATDTVAVLQHDWARVNYELQGEQQKAAYEALIERADAAVAENHGSAPILIWNGIIKSSYAGIKGGLGALSLAKKARKSLRAAMAIDDTALDGSAYTSLGTLYYRVPGWPLGFGSDKKAVKLLEKALEINPEGIDSNYFYADYLIHNKEFNKAQKYLLRAQQAAPRVSRPVADAGRQKEILAALSGLRGKLKNQGS